MIAREIAVEERPDAAVLSAVVESPGIGEPFRLEYAFRGLPPGTLTASGDPFVPALLLPAMALGEDLAVEAPVSPRLLEGVRTAVEIYRAWERPMREYGDWHKGALARVAVVAPARRDPARRGSRVGLFFTCGVDAFYTLLKRNGPSSGEGRVTDLILVNGLDPLRNDPLFDRIAENARRVGAEVGAEVVEVKTNLRELADPLADYALHQGAALISVGLALGGWLGTCVVSSGNAYGVLRPWGTHPLLDPHWSTEGVEVVHDGCEALRAEKMRVVAESQLAMDTLRVCIASLGPGRETRYNCGRCYKCLGTMIYLDLLGALGRCRTLPPVADPDRAVRRALLARHDPTSVVTQLRMLLTDSERHRAYAGAIDRALRWNRRRKFLLRHPRLRTLLRPLGRLTRYSGWEAAGVEPPAEAAQVSRTPR